MRWASIVKYSESHASKQSVKRNTVKSKTRWSWMSFLLFIKYIERKWSKKLVPLTNGFARLLTHLKCFMYVNNHKKCKKVVQTKKNHVKILWQIKSNIFAWQSVLFWPSGYQDSFRRKKVTPLVSSKTATNRNT